MTRHDVPVTEEWDAFYVGGRDGAAVWSGRPNGALAAEAADLPAGTALDVGCGEGADAIWLASRGWKVTAVDPSRVALDRAEAAARAAGVDVAWVHAGLLDMPGGTGQHDLVSAQYAVLRRPDEDAAMATLLGAVAPGGTLLVVHHDLDAVGDHHLGGGHRVADDRLGGASDDAGRHGFDRSDHLAPRNILRHLGADWTVEVYESRPRAGDLPSDAHRAPDVVLRARRWSGAG